MADLSVDGIVLKGRDAADAEITEVYAKDPPSYAVYLTKDRVMVHYADDPAEAAGQRTALVRLNPLRGDINGLIDGWRWDTPRLQAKAKRYQRRIADALVVALEKDPDGAMGILQEAKSDIIDERTSVARFQYLLAAAIAVLAVALLVWALSRTWFPNLLGLFPASAHSLWVGAGAGALGAFFSIAVGIRSRTVLTDLRRLDNLSDAVLRITIGVIASVILICLLKSGITTVTFGTARLNPGAGGDLWITVFVFGFLGGFSERLVPDLLAKIAAPPGPPAPSPTPAPPAPAAVAAVAGGAAAPPAAPADDAAGGAAEGADEDADGCIADDQSATADADLPATAGGVAAPATETSG
jgi:hypothetical protein